MIYICVICMVKRPPLSPLSAEHRTLLEAIVSPVINTEELKDWHWLHCADCKVLMQSVYNFQQTALVGVKKLKYLFRELNKADNFAAGANSKVSIKTTSKPETSMLVAVKKEENLKMPFKIEPEPEVLIPSSKKEMFTATVYSNADPLTEELDVKSEPESRSEFDPGPEHDSESTLSCESEHDDPSTPSNTYISAPSTVTVRVKPKKPPEPVKSHKKLEGSTHRPRPALRSGPYQHPGPYLTCIRWKGGVGEPLRIRKKYKPVKVSCPHCGKSMSNFSLNLHIARMHGVLATCECDVCGKQCRNQTVLKYHKAYMHNEANPAAFCVECNLQCRNMLQYKKHMRTTNKHAAESDFRYECEVCSKKFVTQANLQTHSSVHIDAVFPCDQCEQTFRSRTGRRSHIRTKHEGKVPPRKLLCDYCGKGFPNKTQLSSHMNTHTGTRPFVCKLCGADFGHKSALYLHGRYKHKIQKIKKKGNVITKKNSEKDSSVKENSEKDHSEKTSVVIVKDKVEMSS